MDSNDLSTAIDLKINHGLSFGQIAKQIGAPRSTVYFKLQPIMKMIEHPDMIDVYEGAKPQLLSAAEIEMLSLLMDKNKQKKATLGNVGYVLKQINEINRLSRGQFTSKNINIDVEISDTRYQEFLRLKNTPKKEVSIENDSGNTAS